MEKPSPTTLLLTLVLLLLAPLLQARELGAYMRGARVYVSSSLPASDGDDGPVPLELSAMPAGVGRPGGRAPPAPKPSYGPQPLHEPSPSSHGLSIGSSSSSSGVSGRQGRAPPPPDGNPPPHYGRSGPAADVLDALRVFRDALVRYVAGA